MNDDYLDNTYREMVHYQKYSSYVDLFIALGARIIIDDLLLFVTHTFFLDKFDNFCGCLQEIVMDDTY